MRAVVVAELNAKAEVREVELGPVEAGQVRVRVHRAGVCHSDLSVQNGTIPHPLPAVLGHEGCGVVEEVGAGVAHVREGDRVILNWIPFCGSCFHCLRGETHLCPQGLTPGFTRHTSGGQPVFPMASVGCFAEQTVVPAGAVVPIPADVPFEVGALIGCGVATGVGAAINTARVRPGSTVVVFGCGGVGLNVIQGARVCGAAAIVAVDKVERKLEWARRFGATHAVLPEDLAGVSQEVTGGIGFDYAFEVIGLSQTIRAAFDAARRGGTVTVVGVGRMEDLVTLSAFELFYNEKKLQGCLYGSCNVRVDFPRLIALWRGGQLDLEGLVSRRIGLEDVQDAFGALERGEVIRQVIEVS